MNLNQTPWAAMYLLIGGGLLAAGCYDFTGISEPTPDAPDLGVTDGEASDLAEPDLGRPPKPARFNATPTYGVENGPLAIALGDLNGDGKNDLATANAFARSVSVLLGTGGGEFAPARSFPSGGVDPSCLGIADFDGDGLRDVVVGNHGSQSVVLLSGDGKGGFARQTVVAQGFAPSWMRVADFNGDKLPDLLVGANRSSEPVRLLRNRGKGLFATSSVPAPDTSSPLTSDGVVADWNGDGKLDYAVAVSGMALVGVGVALSQPDGTFALAPWSHGDLAWDVHLAAGDFDGDGKPDLFVHDRKALLILAGQGDGSFKDRASLPAGNAHPGIVVAELNGDQRVDVAYLDSHSVHVGLGRGDGTFAEWQYAAVGWLTLVIAGDVDGDAHPDLVTFTALNNRVAVLRGAGKGAFLAPDMYTCCAGNGIVGAAHLDGDQRLDLVFAGGAGLRPTINVGDGRFRLAMAPAPSASAPQALAIADFDGSGAVDIVVSDSSRNEVDLHRGAKSGTFLAPLRFAAGRSPFAMAAGDLDGDAYRDLVVVNPTTDRVSVLRGDPTGLRALTSHAAGKWPIAVAIGDANGDRRSDLFVVNRDGDSVSVLLATGGGSFASQVQFPVGDFPRAIAAADLDGDGALDLAVADGLDGDVALLKGRGDGNFAPATRAVAGPVPLFLEVGDFNGDGRPDLGVGNDASQVRLLLGRPWLHFTAPELIFAVPHADDVAGGFASGDFDGDGRLDFVVGSRDRFVVLRNLTTP